MMKWGRYITPLYTEKVLVRKGDASWGYMKIFIFGIRIAVLQKTAPWKGN